MKDGSEPPIGVGDNRDFPIDFDGDYGHLIDLENNPEPGQDEDLDGGLYRGWNRGWDELQDDRNVAEDG